MKIFWFSDDDCRKWELIYADSEENAWKLFQVFCDEYDIDINDYDIEKVTILNAASIGRIASLVPEHRSFTVFRAPIMPEVFDETRKKWRIMKVDELPGVVVEEPFDD